MKKLTLEDIKVCANHLGVETAALQAVISVETRGAGFYKDGTPIILFEPHIFYRLLSQKKLSDILKLAVNEIPHLCYPRWGQRPYGTSSSQHARLAIAAKYDRDSALESCSWGLGQVMGFHWRALGYDSLQAFVNAMYQDEKSQLLAMCRFIRTNGLDVALKNKDWVRFARGYNGAGFAKNAYHIKLKQAYERFL